MFAGFSFDDLTEDNPEYKDVYYKCVELINKKSITENELFAEPLKEMVESYAEKLIDRTNEINKLEMDFFMKYGKVEMEDDDTKKLAASENFIRSCFYGDLNTEIFNFNLDDDLPPADEGFKNGLWDAEIPSIVSGTETLTSIKFEVSVNNGAKTTHEWTGELPVYVPPKKEE